MTSKDLEFPLSRRSILKVGAAAAGAGVIPLAFISRAFGDEGFALAYSVSNLSSPSQSLQVKGGEAFAKSIGKELSTLLSGGNSEKGIADVQAVLAKFNGKVALMIDPLNSPDARVIVEECKKAGAYVVTIWNKPNDLHPWDFNPNYVAHISFDGVNSGSTTAEALFKKMGGTGGIVALGGIANNIPAIDRKAGLDKAIGATNGAVKLLDFQVADWASSKAFQATQAWLTRFGNDIKGIWAANDEMAMGAIEALRAEGLNGKIPVSGIDGTPPALEAIVAGDLTATSDWDPYLAGSLGLSLAYNAATGKFDPPKEPKEHREFYGRTKVIDAENVKQMLQQAANRPAIDYSKPWDFVVGPIRY